jgi:DNA-binding NarL/FixJ family response regulator
MASSFVCATLTNSISSWFFKSLDKFSIQKISSSKIIKVIHEAYGNRVSIHSDVSDVLRKELVKAKKELRLQSLTPGEREVYELKQDGYNKLQIAEKLHKSLHTIKNQWKSARAKLKIK